MRPAKEGQAAQDVDFRGTKARATSAGGSEPSEQSQASAGQLSLRHNTSRGRVSGGRWSGLLQLAQCSSLKQAE